VVVVRCGTLVAKAHRPDTNPVELAARVHVAGHSLLAGIMLPPLDPTPTQLGDRQVSLWPAGVPVDPTDVDGAPWEQAARLLARLHKVPPLAISATLPPAGGPARLARALAALDQLPATPSTRDVGAAAVTLPASVWHPVGGCLVHGDWHLGQLVRPPGDCRLGWQLIDIDDLGIGDPTWDLARPAAFFAAGLVSAGQWQRFLTAYRVAGGPAIPAEGDPWTVLDVPARALLVQVAARSIAHAHRQGRDLDEIERVLVASCRRIGQLAGVG
jgi:hypothetical protein